MGKLPQHLSTSNERYTPPEIIEPVRRAFGGVIALDPASCEQANKTIKALQYFTENDNGLARPWLAPTVWCNPPYGTNADLGVANQLLWAKKIASEYAAGNFRQGALLVSAATGDAFFRAIWATATLVIFPYRRIKFLDESGNRLASPPNANAIAYYGRELHQAIEHFSGIGAVVRCISRSLVDNL